MMATQRPINHVLIKCRAGEINEQAVLWGQAASSPSGLSPPSNFHTFKFCGGEFHTRNSHARATYGESYKIRGLGDGRPGD